MSSTTPSSAPSNTPSESSTYHSSSSSATTVAAPSKQHSTPSTTEPSPDGFIRSLVERVAPSILKGRNENLSTVDELEARHVAETGTLIMQRSRIIANIINNGTCAIVGATYTLSDGRIRVRNTLGTVGEHSDDPPKTPT